MTRIKQIALVTKQSGMTRQAFIDRYEDGHAPLALRIVPYFCDYRRNYVVPGSAFSLGGTTVVAKKPSFTGMSEFWYLNQAKLDALTNALAVTDAGDQITRDEAAFMNRSKITMFTADEFITPPSQIRNPGDGGDRNARVKMVILDAKREGVSRDDFISGNEAHVPKVLDILRDEGRLSISEHRRSYPIEGSPFKLPHVEDVGQTLGFDAMTEIWFSSAADFELFRELCSKLGAKNPITSFTAVTNPTATSMFLVDEYVTKQGDLTPT